MIKTVLLAVTAACKAYTAYVEHSQWNSVDKIEDEIDKLSRGDLDSDDKLRIKRLLLRKKRHVERIQSLRPTPDPSDSGSDLPV